MPNTGRKRCRITGPGVNWNQLVSAKAALTPQCLEVVRHEASKKRGHSWPLLKLNMGWKELHSYTLEGLKKNPERILCVFK